ncbi:hypothetical protein ACFLYT_00420 [Nanoarchaeota archaeon]
MMKKIFLKFSLSFILIVGCGKEQYIISDEECPITYDSEGLSLSTLDTISIEGVVKTKVVGRGSKSVATIHYIASDDGDYMLLRGWMTPSYISQDDKNKVDVLVGKKIKLNGKYYGDLFYIEGCN